MMYLGWLLGTVVPLSSVIKVPDPGEGGKVSFVSEFQFIIRESMGELVPSFVEGPRGAAVLLALVRERVHDWNHTQGTEQFCHTKTP